MANALLTPQVIAHEANAAFRNKLPFLMNVGHEFEDRFGQEGAKIGDTYNLRRPNQVEADEGAAITTMQDFTERQQPLVIEKQFKVPFQFGTRELSLTVDAFRERYIEPAVIALANKVENYCLTKAYRAVYNSVGTPGAVPTSLKTYMSASAKLDDHSVPGDNKRCVMITPSMQVEVIHDLRGLFAPDKTISKQFLEARMGRAAGLDWYMGQNVRRHTVGALGGTPLVNGANQSGTNIITDGWTAAAATRLKAGDVFTMDGVYDLNRVSYEQLDYLKQFTVAADTASDGSGNMTIPITEELILTGPYRNASASPADNAALTIVGAANTVTPQGLVWHPEAFSFSAPPLMNPASFGCWGARSVDKDSGISVRVVKQYDIKLDQVVTRLDIICGFVVRQPAWACRVQS